MRMIALGLLAISGLTFWFLLGFPFANHNESFLWVIQFDDFSFLDTLTQRMTGANHRPVSTLGAWLSYRLSGGQLWPVQIVNYLIAAAAWLALFYGVKEKKAFSVISAVGGGIFFAGYIYLFHLHGFAYGPVLFLVGMCFLFYQREVTTRGIIGMFLLAVAATLSHPFASLIYLAFAAGLLLSNWKALSRGQRGLLLGAMLATAALTHVLMNVLAADKDVTAQITLQALMVSFRMVEANMLVSAAAMGFALLTVLSLDVKMRYKVAIALGACVLGAGCKVAGMPVLFAWIAVCLLKTVIQRRWSLALLLIATLSFPAFSRVGSPTYGIFLLMACTAVTAIGWTGLELRLGFLNYRLAGAAVLLVVVVGGLLRAGVTIPGLSTAAGLVLAEREKTVQLEKVITWMSKSKYSDYALLFWDEGGNPTASDNALKRTYRPPTYGPVLNYYLNHIHHRKYYPIDRLSMVFGGQECYAGDEVFRVKGKFAGDAVVYLTDY